MNDSITLNLSHDLLVKAKVWAQQSGRPLAEFLAESLESTLAPFSDSAGTLPDRSDQQVIEALEYQLDPALDQRLSQLLQLQQNGELTIAQSEELQQLMTVYHEGLLNKSAALREAVRRGLRNPPAS